MSDLGGPSACRAPFLSTTVGSSSEPFAPFVAAAGLIAPVDDVDAVALANGLARYKACSIELLARRLGEASNSSPSDLTRPVSLLESTMGILSPDRWIQQGYKPAGKAHHCIVWFKAEVERVLAESRA